MNDTQYTEKKHTEKKRILTLYALLGASLLLCIVPWAPAGIIALLFFIAVLLMAYTSRKRAKQDSLLDNHAGFIIRTLWIGSFYALITTGLGTAYLLRTIDNTLLTPCVNQVIQEVPHMQGSTADLKALSQMLDPCMGSYLNANGHSFTIALLISAGPVLAFMVLRLFRGLSRAMRSERVPNPKSWV